jgi:cytidylate kinase
MEKCKNRIITLSGDPGSGKGSVSRRLNEIHEAAGLKSHIVSVGDLFRKIVVREYKKKFPEVQEPTLEEIYGNPDFAEELKEIDANMDNEIANLVEEFHSQSTTGEVLILDSRRAAIIIEKLAEKIPEISQICFHVRLETDARTAGERVFNDPKRGTEDQYSSLEEAIQDTESRKEKEIQSCKEQYGKDLSDHSHFNLIIGTTLASIDDIASTIHTCDKLASEGKPFAKTWASPELFYPTQIIERMNYDVVWMIEDPEERKNSRDYPFATTKRLRELYPNQQIDHNTKRVGKWVRGTYDLEEYAHSIAEKGIYPDKPVDAISMGKSVYKFVKDGHHRVFGSIMARKTLIPYRIVEHKEEEIVSQEQIDIIHIHENEIRMLDGSRFKYAVYPEVERENDSNEQEQ